jgi:hypothetical protein
VSEDNLAFDGRSRSWDIWIWSASKGLNLAFMCDGSNIQAVARSSISPGGLRVVGAVTDRQLVPLLDSPQALERAEVLGGREFRLSTDSHLVGLVLMGHLDGRLSWAVKYFGSQGSREIAIDAETGGLIYDKRTGFS